jgi:hypothetical protein
MGLYRRRVCIDLTQYITTGQTGAFNLPQFPSFGVSGKSNKNEEFVFSNSDKVSGSTQFSFFVCCSTTNGVGNNNKYLNIPLKNENANQAWLVKNLVIGAGTNPTNQNPEYYSAEVNAVVKSSQNGTFYVVGPITNLYARSNQNLNVTVESVGTSGIRYKFIDAYGAEMKWTSKIDVVQTVYTNESITLERSYYSGNQDWYDLSNWYVDSSFGQNLDILPQSSTYVYSYGSNAPHVDLDNPSWVQPYIINISNMSGPTGICLTSSTGAIFSGQIICGTNQIYFCNVIFS